MDYILIYKKAVEIYIEIQVDSWEKGNFNLNDLQEERQNSKYSSTSLSFLSFFLDVN